MACYSVVCDEACYMDASEFKFYPESLISEKYRDILCV